MSTAPAITADWRSSSEALHERVRRFADAALAAVPARAPADDFERLAFDIAAHQVRHNPVVARLAARRPGPASALHELPAVPADVFRFARVASHPEADDVARFSTSGTTGGAGVHVFRTLETYRELSVAWGRRALFGDVASARCTALALAPPFEPERRSSLGFMLQEFIERFDGRPLLGARPGAAASHDHWLLGDVGLDRERFERGVAVAHERGEPVLLLATAFALVWLLDALGDSSVPLPPGSVVMQTGGFKGKSREIPAPELVSRTSAVLSVPPARIIGEYGMTELGSQLYDEGFVLGAGAVGSVYREPPWLSVLVVDPERLEPVAPGEVGLARFVDLTNIDSALVVQTQDRVRRLPNGIELLGRQPGAVPRGCSLAVEALASELGAELRV